MIKDVSVDIYMLTQYFDDSEFDTSPIKNTIKYYNYKLLTEVS